MSISVGISSDNFNIASNENIAVVSVTKGVGTFNHKVLLELTYTLHDNGVTPQTKTISFVNQFDGNDNVIYNLSDIYQTIVTPKINSAALTDVDPTIAISNKISTIHTLPNTSAAMSQIYSWGINKFSGFDQFRGNAQVLDLKFYEMNSSTSTGVPVKIPSSEVQKDIFLLWGRANESDPVILKADNFWSDYILSSDQKQFLSSNYNIVNGQPIIEIGKDEFHTLSFLNRCPVNTFAFPEQIHALYYDESDVNIGFMTIDNTSGSGGAYGSVATDPSLKRGSCFLFFGSGLANLNRVDTTEASYTGVIPNNSIGGIDNIAYYTLQVRSLSPTTNRSKLYRFNVINYCDKYEQVRIAFMNRFGAWEYKTFNKEKTSELKINRTNIEINPLSRQDSFASSGGVYLDSNYSPTLAKQGTRTSSVSYDETFTLHTDYLKDYEIEMIKDLVMSPQIHLLDGVNSKALILETSTMKLKGEKETGLYKYELKFSFALPKYKTILS